MNKWQYTLDVKEAWQKVGEGQDISSFCKILVKELNLIPDYLKDDELGDLIDYFTSMSEDEDVSIEEFDHVLNDLYNWADTDKRLWIGTF
jgi:hypothetical protein